MTKSERKNNAKPRKESKPMTRGQKVIFIILFLLLLAGILFGIILINGYNVLNSQGFSSNDTLIRTYLSAIDNNKESDIKKSFCIFASDYDTITEQQSLYASVYHDMIIMDIDNIEVESYEYDDIDNDVTLPASKILMNNVKIPTTKTKDGITYITSDTYHILSYEYGEKWYIWALSSEETVISGTDSEGNAVNISEFQTNADLSSDKTQLIGDSRTGYIYVGNDWTQMSDTLDVNEESRITYANSNSTAIISLSALRNDDSASATAKQLYDELDADTTTYDLKMEDVTIGNYSASLVHCKIDSAYYAVWIFDTPVKDAYTHCITVECVESYITKAEDYVNTFHFE